MKSKLYTLILSFFVLISTISVSAQYDILYLGKADVAIDSAVMEYFGLEGYSVTFVAEADFKVEGSDYASAAIYDDFDVLYVSESIGSSSANNFKTAGFPIPAVVTEGFVAKQGRWSLLADDGADFFKQASSADLTTDVLTLMITDNDLWLTEEFDQDYYLVWAETLDATKLGVTSFYLEDDVDGAIPVGEFLFDMGGMPAMWAIPAGSTLSDDTELPNMVIFGVIQTDVGQTFTAEFKNLLVRSVRWVTDDYVIENVDTRESYHLVTGPNPTDGIVNFSIDLPESGKIGVDIYDITGKMVKSHKAEYMNAGKNDIQLDFSNLSDAQYIYRISTTGDILTGKIIKK